MNLDEQSGFEEDGFEAYINSDKIIPICKLRSSRCNNFRQLKKQVNESLNY